MKHYYTCEHCHYQFERYGECEACPDCGKSNIRESTENEINEYLLIKTRKEKW